MWCTEKPLFARGNINKRCFLRCTIKRCRYGENHGGECKRIAIIRRGADIFKTLNAICHWHALIHSHYSDIIWRFFELGELYFHRNDISGSAQETTFVYVTSLLPFSNNGFSVQCVKLTRNIAHGSVVILIFCLHVAQVR
jgi:hypothetical protein